MSFAREVEKISQISPPPIVSSDPLPEPPDHMAWRSRRERKPMQAAHIDTSSLHSVEEAYNIMQNAALDYIENDETQALLLSVVAGGGKTHLAVWLAHHLARNGKRVLFLAPRHDMWADVMEVVRSQGENEDYWFHWQARQSFINAERPETCKHPFAIAAWLKKGHKAAPFCKTVCGQSYIDNQCVYFKQQRDAINFPIIFCQHQHLFFGHPLMGLADVIIGDESPLGVVPKKWEISSSEIIPTSLAVQDVLMPLLRELSIISIQKEQIKARELLEKLGGADEILRLTDDYEPEYQNTNISPLDDKKTDYNHLSLLAHMLRIEATYSQMGHDYYNGRVIVGNGKLVLLDRHNVHQSANNKKLIWLDATGDAGIYEHILQREVLCVRPRVKLQGKIHYIDSALNNKTSLIVKNKPTNKVAKIADIIRYKIKENAYKDPVIISHQLLRNYFGHLGHFGHFGAERGTNRYQQCDAAFIVGVQQPALDDIVDLALMLDSRMERHNATWTVGTRPYHSQDTGRDISQFADDSLNSLLWQLREAEIVQAAHRVRPARRNADVWLMTTIPIAELPDDALESLRDVYKSPATVEPAAWGLLREISDSFRNGDTLDASYLMRIMSISDRTARKYMQELAVSGEWQMSSIKTNGRPKPILVKILKK